MPSQFIHLKKIWNMHILNVKVECIFYFDEQNQITPGAMVHIGLHMSKILSMQKCFARTDIEIGKKGRPEFIFLRNMYGWLFDIRCTLLCISALFLICFHSSVYMFFSLYICLFICTFVLFCIFLLFSMVTTGWAAGCSTSEIKLGLAPDKSGNGASSAWSHFAHLLFLSHWEASALPCLMPGHSLPDHIHCVTRPEFWPIPTLFCPFLRPFLTLEKRTSLPLSTRYPIRYKAWCALSPLPSKIFCSQCCSLGKVAIIAASVDLLHVMSTITPWNYLSFKVCPYIQIMTQKPWPANHSVPQKTKFFLVSQEFNQIDPNLGSRADKYHISISEINHAISSVGFDYMINALLFRNYITLVNRV